MSDLLRRALEITAGRQNCRDAVIAVDRRVDDGELATHDGWAISDSTHKLMWLRPVEAPLVRLWAIGVGLAIPPSLDETAERLLKTWPLDRTIVARNAIYRRYLLRYYLRSGAITREQFNVHRCKTTAQMDTDPRLRSL